MGSGNWYRFDKKVTIDECHSVDVRYLYRQNLLQSGSFFSLRWSRAGKERTEIDGDYWGKDLETLCKESKTSTFTTRKVSDGLLLLGIRSAQRSLANKLLEDVSFDWTDKLQGSTEYVQSLIDKDFGDDNRILLGAIHDPDHEYHLTAGMVPLFWWPIDLDVLREIFFYDIHVIHIYNPAHFAAKLRRAGFEVESIEGQRGFKVQKKVGGGILTLENFECFVYLVTNHFWFEDAVVESLSRMVEWVNDRAEPPHPMEVKLDMQQHFGPRPDEHPPS